ncbi:carbon monoxide dehydrogenase subunit G [Sandarakinorhabdus sp. AAP62]|uniref:SRPBCC family protein n=1 Tax=Sandarakinorhabdus sp. AAP62 TaxID=1248916 RepID=UPI000300A528|nr:carbon monoxide dehydrogenase subunit G [Sandarakinorhabdus sp. AAP62]
MDLAGSVEIASPRQILWAALNDPDMLARCIEGVESLTRTEADVPVFDGVMQAKVGPVRARFAGTVRLEEIVAPVSYRLVGEGKGGVAGFAKGSADVVLTELSPTKTQLDYVVKAQVGGKLAQLGARLVEGAARQYAEAFFAKLKSEVETPQLDIVALAAASDEATAAGPEPATGGLSAMIWGSGLIIVTLLFLLWQWSGR